MRLFKYKNLSNNNNKLLNKRIINYFFSLLLIQISLMFLLLSRVPLWTKFPASLPNNNIVKGLTHLNLVANFVLITPKLPSEE